MVNEYSQTNVPSIYAVGDVTDRVQLTPVAIREGMAFVETVFNGNPTKVDHALIPSAIFTQPEMGTIACPKRRPRRKRRSRSMPPHSNPCRRPLRVAAARC